MKQITWNELKNQRLKKVRGVSFEEILQAKLIKIQENPARPNQSILLFNYRSYVWVVPCVETEKEIFLKTLYPSRKYTKLYEKGA